MGKTIRGEKGDGFDYWKSRGPKGGKLTRPGKLTKDLTNKFERRQTKNILRDKDYPYEDQDKSL